MMSQEFIGLHLRPLIYILIFPKICTEQYALLLFRYMFSQFGTNASHTSDKSTVYLTAKAQNKLYLISDQLRRDCGTRFTLCLGRVTLPRSLSLH